MCPWVQLDGEGLNPPWMQFAHKLPDVLLSSIIPRVLTHLSSGTINLMGWSNPSQQHLQAAKLVTAYATLQGQAGNEQMVQLALSKSYTYLPQDLDHTLFVYHGAQDKLVLEDSVAELVRLLQERRCPTKYVLVPHGDHNSVLARAENLTRVLQSLGNNVHPFNRPKTAPQRRTKSSQSNSRKTLSEKQNSTRQSLTMASLTLGAPIREGEPTTRRNISKTRDRNKSKPKTSNYRRNPQKQQENQRRFEV